MNDTNSKKLALHSDTVRTLTNGDLAAANGGAGPKCSVVATTLVNQPAPALQPELDSLPADHQPAAPAWRERAGGL